MQTRHCVHMHYVQTRHCVHIVYVQTSTFFWDVRSSLLKTKSPVSQFFSMLWPIQGVTMSKGTARAFRRCATYGGGYDLIHSYRPSKSVQILINLSVDYRFDQEEALPRWWRRRRRGHLGLRTELMNNSSELHRPPKPNIFWKLMTNTIHQCHPRWRWQL